MKVGLIGLSLAGKTTVLRAVTGIDAPASHGLGERHESHHGVVSVPDERLNWVGDAYRREKRVHTGVELVDQAGIRPGAADRAGSFDAAVRAVDALAVVVRAFRDPGVPHPLEEVDPARDLRVMAEELVLADLQVVEKRIERLEKDLARGKREGEKELHILVRCREALEKCRPLYSLEWTHDEAELLRGFAFLTGKPAVTVANVGEEGLVEEAARGLRGETEKIHAPLAVLAAKLELELVDLDPTERESFRASYGLDESARDALIRTVYETLDVITFYTAGEHEVRAWTLPRGGTALDAAHHVHSDMARGFVRAEVIHFDEFKACSSVAAAREKGLYRLEGREYVVKDGDLILVKFSP